MPENTRLSDFLALIFAQFSLLSNEDLSLRFKERLATGIGVL
jgi:hypothetical protein